MGCNQIIFTDKGNKEYVNTKKWLVQTGQPLFFYQRILSVHCELDVLRSSFSEFFTSLCSLKVLVYSLNIALTCSSNSAEVSSLSSALFAAALELSSRSVVSVEESYESSVEALLSSELGSSLFVVSVEYVDNSEVLLCCLVVSSCEVTACLTIVSVAESENTHCVVPVSILLALLEGSLSLVILTHNDVCSSKVVLSCVAVILLSCLLVKFNLLIVVLYECCSAKKCCLIENVDILFYELKEFVV